MAAISVGVLVGALARSPVAAGLAAVCVALVWVGVEDASVSVRVLVIALAVLGIALINLVLSHLPGF